MRQGPEGHAYGGAGGGERWLLLDGPGSGLAIGAADDARRPVDTIEGSAPEGVTPHVVMTTNAYGLARGRDRIDAQTAEHVRFDGYEAYAGLILGSRRRKDDRAAAPEAESEAEPKASTGGRERRGRYGSWHRWR